MERKRNKMFYILYLPGGWLRRNALFNVGCWVNISEEAQMKRKETEEWDWNGLLWKHLFFFVQTGEDCTISELWWGYAFSIKVRKKQMILIQSFFSTEFKSKAMILPAFLNTFMSAWVYLSSTVICVKLC